MCEGVNFGEMFSGKNMILASSAMGGISQIVQANQGGKYLEYQSAQSLADADAERQAGAMRAGKVRKAGGVISGEAMAAQGASGSSVNSGTALAVREYIDRGAESDALTELYGGQRKASSLTATAAGYRMQAANTRSAGYGAFGKSLLTGAGKAREAQEANDRWLRLQRKGVATFGDQYSIDDPAYG